MGDNVVFHVKGSGVSVISKFYGEDAIEILQTAMLVMCLGNPFCSSARLIGVLHMVVPGNIFLATIPGPPDLEDSTLKRFSRGDAGIVIYDCDTGMVSCHYGYLADEHPSPFFAGMAKSDPNTVRCPQAFVQ